MRHTLAGLLLSLSALPAAALSAQDFEGTITVRMAAGRNGTPAPDLEYLARGGKVRINARSPMGSVAMIAVPAEKTLYTLMDAQSMYMEQPLSLDGAPGAGASTPAPTITRTGRKETIAGHECEHILIAGQQGSTDVCMARGLGPFFAAGAALGSAMPAWQRALISDGGFPLKVSRADGTTQLEVTKIERKKLNDALFTVPEHYTRMDMPTGRRG
jgi:hypothetical protein